VTPVKPREAANHSVSTLALHQKKKKTKAPMVVIEVRRSVRLKVISRGFKGKHCEKANCFWCSIEPPSLSKKVIKSLGTYFYKIKPGALIEEALQNKPKKAIRKNSRAQAVSKNVKDDDTKK
jgi:hypothetical protein